MNDIIIPDISTDKLKEFLVVFAKCIVNQSGREADMTTDEINSFIDFFLDKYKTVDYFTLDSLKEDLTNWLNDLYN